MRSRYRDLMSTGPTTDARPLQVRIADDIRAKIETGEYAPGQQIPILGAIAAEYSCSGAPVRAAIEALKQQGLLITRQGKGTFVRERARARRHGMERYSRATWSGGTAILIAEAAQQGLEAGQAVRFVGAAPAPDAVAERLGVEPDTEVHVRRRTTKIGDRPNQLADSYYPLDLAEAVPALKDKHTGPGGGFARIEEAGYRLARIREEIALRMPTGPESSVLELPEGTPVAELIRTAYDTQGRPLEVMIAVIAGDMVTFNYDFPVPD
jgi:GntR family transcriptional regulator